ncbi:MAG: hypothetical protein PHV02_02290 [Rhodocyclaceae bacterium]|nr:hypothetical protein [Rhodocyclaceae bacterium]
MSLSTWIRRKFALGNAGDFSDERMLSELEFLLLDVELTGTDAETDKVIGLAALPLLEGAFSLDELRYCHFSQSAESTGSDPALTGESLATYQAIIDQMSRCIVVTINPVFVRHMLEKSTADYCLPAPSGHWLDLSAVAAVVGNDAGSATSLAHWLAKMKTCGRHEHDAVYDVFAMAQLLQALLAYADEAGITTLADLMRNQNAENWLRPFKG